jgi:hypothetical protein
MDIRKMLGVKSSGNRPPKSGNYFPTSIRATYQRWVERSFRYTDPQGDRNTKSRASGGGFNRYMKRYSDPNQHG